MVRNGNANAATRRRYQRPRVSRVRLVAEEAVLTACKMFASPGPGPDQNTCSVLSIVDRCFEVGS